MARACGLEDGDPVFLSVGRHHPEKRLGTLIDAIRRLNRTRRAGLFMLGDGPIRPLIEKWAASAPHIHIAGNVADRSLVASYLASADALFHGSASETFGLAVAEALSCGTPVIVPTVGGAADLADSECAETYVAGDSEAAAAAALRLLARGSDALRDTVAATAAIRIGNADIHFDAMFALYEDLLARHQAAAA
jgi:alpha-1,6-mannosyltransferase